MQMNRRLARALNIEDLRRLARKRLPGVVFDYIDGAADAEWTVNENSRAFQDIVFRPRSAVASAPVNLKTSVLGMEIDVPIVLAPVGSSRMFYPKGECVAASVAGEFGTIYTLSTLSGCRLEDVKSATHGRAWYQLYLLGGHDAAKRSIARAKAAGYAALVVTIDTPVAGYRERDFRGGASELIEGNPIKMMPHVGQVLTRPRWLVDFLLDGGMMKFPNVLLDGGEPMPYSDIGSALAASAVSWRDFAWIKDAWGGPIIAKGVHTADDARNAVAAGADAVVVSNHGGRQLDGVAGTISVLPEVVDAVGDRVEVLLDGGIRRGSDVVKALCLGAKAVLVGRAYAYGLAAGGRDGVERALQILRADVTRTMNLLGVHDVRELSTEFARPKVSS